MTNVVVVCVQKMEKKNRNWTIQIFTFVRTNNAMSAVRFPFFSHYLSCSCRVCSVFYLDARAIYNERERETGKKKRAATRVPYPKS